jgi:hypothetical protein
MSILAADRGKEVGIKAFVHRVNNPPTKIDNASLRAGSPMYFYCRICRALAATLPEGFLSPPPALCDECAALKKHGWLPDALKAAGL